MWAMPVLLLFILLGFLGYRYRWVAPPLRPVQNVEFQVQVRADKAEGEVVVTVDNYRSEALKIQFDELTWNEAPMRSKLPPEQAVEPYARRTWRFAPIDPRVADYGDQVEVHYRAGYGVMEADYAYGGPFNSGPGSHMSHMGSQLNIGFSTSEDDPPLEVRNAVAIVNGKVIGRRPEVHRMEPGEPYIVGSVRSTGSTTIDQDCEYRLTPWSPWRSPPR
jgi:hypothetical protein